MQRLLGQKTGSCFQRCVGMDAINALWSVTWETDQAKGTDYHERFRTYVQFLQDEDLVADGAMTDVKGDRGLVAPRSRPIPTSTCTSSSAATTASSCAAPRPTRPAPATRTRSSSCRPSPCARATRTMPSRFSTPANAPGIFYVYGRQCCDTRKLEENELDVGNAQLRRPRSPHGLRRRLRALGARLHGRRDRVLRRPRRALRRLPPPELRRLQGRRGRRADRRRRAGRRLQRRRQGQPRQGQAHRDDAPERDPVLVRHRLLGRGRQDAVRQLPDRHAAGQRLQAERDPLPLRDRAPRRRHRRRPHGHHALRPGPLRREDRPVGREAPGAASATRRRSTACASCAWSRTSPWAPPPSATAPSRCTAPARRRRSAS